MDLNQRCPLLLLTFLLLLLQMLFKAYFLHDLSLAQLVLFILERIIATLKLKPQRRPFNPKHLGKLIFQIPLIRTRQLCGLITMNYDHRWVRAPLVCIT